MSVVALAVAAAARMRRQELTERFEALLQDHAEAARLVALVETTGLEDALTSVHSAAERIEWYMCCAYDAIAAGRSVPRDAEELRELASNGLMADLAKAGTSSRSAG